MAVPKRKTSKARRDSRRANNSVECPKCHELKAQHTVCKNCGYYDGREVINMEDDK